MKTSTKILLGVGVPLVSLSPLVSLASCSNDDSQYKYFDHLKSDFSGLYVGIKNMEWRAIKTSVNGDIFHYEDYPFTFLGDLWYKPLRIYNKKSKNNNDQYLIDITRSEDEIQTIDTHLVIKGILVDSPTNASKVDELQLFAFTSPTKTYGNTLKNRLLTNSKDIAPTFSDGHWTMNLKEYDPSNFTLVYNNKIVDPIANNVKIISEQLSEPNPGLDNIQIDNFSVRPITLTQEELFQSGFQNQFAVMPSQYTAPLIGYKRNTNYGIIFFRGRIKPYNPINITSLITGDVNQHIIKYDPGGCNGQVNLYEDYFNIIDYSVKYPRTKPFIKNYKNKDVIQHKKEIFISCSSKQKLDEAIKLNYFNLNTLFRMSDEKIQGVGLNRDSTLNDEQIINLAPYIIFFNKEVYDLVLNDPNYKIRLSDTLDYSSNEILRSKVSYSQYNSVKDSCSASFDYYYNYCSPPTDKPRPNTTINS